MILCSDLGYLWLYGLRGCSLYKTSPRFPGIRSCVNQCALHGSGNEPCGCVCSSVPGVLTIDCGFACFNLVVD
jgi:hypothetical protein